jgi:hypothetical protein
MVWSGNVIQLPPLNRFSVDEVILLSKGWITQPPTDFVWTGTGRDLHQDGQVERMAKLIYMALKGLDTTHQLSLPCFPYITSYGEEPDHTEVTYKEWLHCWNMGKAMAIFPTEGFEGTDGMSHLDGPPVPNGM